jgi:tetratricopeptide (TPR) repeat protein
MQTDADLIATARRLFEARDIERAEAAYREAADADPDRIELRIMIAACRDLQGDAEGAMALLEDATRRWPYDPEPWFHLGRIHHAAGRRSEAKEALARATTLDPNHAQVRVESGRLQLEEDDVDGAEQAFRAALRADPDCVPALSMLAGIVLDRGQLDEAGKLASRAVRRKPEDVNAQLVMSRVFRHQGHLDFAERCLRNGLEVAPDSGVLLAALAALLQERGRDEAAREFLDRARETGYDERRLALAEAASLHQAGRTREAQTRLEQLAERDRLDARGRLLLAELRLGAGDVGGCRELLPVLSRQWPEAAVLVEALIEEQQGAPEDAAQRARALHEAEHGHLRRQARLVSARAAAAAGDAVSCRDALEPLMRAGDRDPTLAWLMADCLDRAGEYAEAADHLGRAAVRSSTMFAAAEPMLSDEVREGMLSLDFPSWPRAPIEDGRGNPVFVLGWPGAGRDALIAAVDAHPEAAMMDTTRIGRRGEVLDWPSRPDWLESLDESRIRLIRKRYFRAAGTRSSHPVEPMWLVATALPTLARVFPAARVIAVEADERDMVLAWRFLGYDRIEAMRAAWRRDRDLLAQLRERLPLSWIVIERGALIDDPAAAVSGLYSRLGLAEAPVPVDAIAPTLRGLRPDGHWRHYAELVEPPAASGSVS